MPMLWWHLELWDELLKQAALLPQCPLPLLPVLHSLPVPLHGPRPSHHHQPPPSLLRHFLCPSPILILRAGGSRGRWVQSHGWSTCSLKQGLWK